MNIYKKLLVGMMFVTIAGCNSKTNSIPPCNQHIPLAATFLNNSLFAALQYQKMQNYTQFLNKGYELWADSKFEFKSVLQYGFIQTQKNTDTQFCTNSVYLRMTLPLNEQQKAMLASFTMKIIESAGMPQASIEKKLSDVVAHNQAFQKITEHNRLTLKAGIAHHQYRGDFLVVGLETS